MNLRHTCQVGSAREPAEAPILFIVDGDAAVRTALETLVRSEGWLARAATSGEEFLALPRPVTPSCLLVELALGDSTGLELQQRVLDRMEMPVVFMSARPDVRSTVQAMKAGAFEFLTKPFADDVLVRTIREALEHSRTALRHVAQTRALQARYESLSRREREVMSLVVTGRLNKQVGGQLGISEITVKAHRGKLMRKMQAGSFAELVSMAVNLHRVDATNPTDMAASDLIADASRRASAVGSYARA
jgi:FixJ family two-component response regulator